MKTLSILSTKLSAWGLHLIGRGGSMPGSIGCKVDKNILTKLKFNGPVILVTGTNGKTSTANMITDLFQNAGYNVISNRKGDNLKAGIVTTLLTNCKLNGEIKANAVVLECDELNVRHILPFIPVTDFVVNNFFRDQLDRAREMEQLIDSIEKVLPDYKGRLILNANDPNVVRLNLVAKNATCSYFGMDENKYSVTTTKEASEGKFCPKCGAKIEEIIENNDPIKTSYNQLNDNLINNDTINDFKKDDVNGETKTNPLAIASLVCSIVGLIIFGLPLGIVSICLSVAAKKHMKIFPNEKGNGMATAGLVIGIIDVVFTSLWTIMNTANLF